MTTPHDDLPPEPHQSLPLRAVYFVVFLFFDAAHFLRALRSRCWRAYLRRRQP